jgi:hypothetical protein
MGNVLLVAGCVVVAAQFAWGIMLRDVLVGCFSAGLLIAGGLLHVADALQAARKEDRDAELPSPFRPGPPPPPPRSPPGGSDDPLISRVKRTP